ncbi:putative FAD-linked oxidoreductase [bacterium BMS3Abin04]|nr:putative FAD-linked oxidoreductase [bacterium BMS3Abin04]
MIIKNDQSQVQSYLSDAANYRGFCDAVYFPESEKELTNIVIEANKNKTPITISGNGTGLTGGRVPEGGIVISTEKLNKIIEIDHAEKYAIVQPGVIMQEFQNIIEEQKLYYPPDPTETNCFIGATVATNASGAKTFKYGSTRNFVLALNIITADGDILYLERGKQKIYDYKLNLITQNSREINCIIPAYKMPETKNAAGYFCKRNMDAIDLFIGSEGTLGIITEIKLKLLDKPQNILSSIIFFDKEINALSFITEAREISYLSRKNSASNNIDALALEFFDSNTLSFLKKDYPQIPNYTRTAVWFEQEYTEATYDLLLNKWINLINKHNGDENTAWFAATNSEREKFKEFRHAVSWKVSEYIAQKNLMKVGTDTAVPDNVFIEFYNYAKELAYNSGMEYVAYGHFGNSHLHLNLLPKDNQEYEQAKYIYRLILEKAVSLDGTISAEHGIGKLKREYLLEMYGEKNIIKMARLKKCLDQNLLLGSGNIFDVKYCGFV